MYVAVCIRYFKKEGDFIKLYNLPVPETRCEQSELFEEWIGLHIEDGESSSPTTATATRKSSLT